MYKIFLHVILPIFIGGLIYLLFRPKNLLIFHFLNWFYLDSWIDILRLNIKYRPSHWIIFCLPDGLWLYSYVYSTALLWKNIINIKNLIWYLIPITIAILSEIGQYFKFIQGTFDWFDIFSYSFFSLMALFISTSKFYSLTQLNLQINEI